MKENGIDSLVFDTLIPKPIIQRYLNLLMEHRRIILSGPSGTGKSFLAAKLAEYIISQMGQEVTEHNVASFNVDQNSSKVERTQRIGIDVQESKSWCIAAVDSLIPQNAIAFIHLLVKVKNNHTRFVYHL